MMTKKILAIVLAFGVTLSASPVWARPGHRDGHGRKHYARQHDRGHHDARHRGHHRVERRHHVVQHRRHVAVRHHVAPFRGFRGRGPLVRLPYRYGYGNHHYRHGRGDIDRAFLWLGLAAVGVTAVSLLSQSQRVYHDRAYYGATTAPIGQPVVWNDGPSSGSWTAVREGYADDGEYCREFQQTVNVGGRSERAYGTACWRPDGSWEVTPR